MRVCIQLTAMDGRSVYLDAERIRGVGGGADNGTLVMLENVFNQYVVKEPAEEIVWRLARLDLLLDGTRVDSVQSAAK